MRNMPRAWRIALLITLAVALAAVGWLLRTPRSPDVVLITVDTLRADHLGCYGSSVARTPAIDALAAGGLLFENAVAPLPETRPSHQTLFTSLYPGDHGVLSNASRLAPDKLALPALFRVAGYATAGFASCSLFSTAAGTVLGFSDFEAAGQSQIAAHEVVPRALDWLAGRDPEQPIFIWLHLFDPHMPLEPPPPYNRGASPNQTEALPSLSWEQITAIAERHGGDLPGEVLDRARELYAGEVEYADHWLGRFFAGLRAVGRDDAVVALAADHGECFENGVFFEHSQCLGEGALAVPLILHAPGRVGPGRVSAAVELLDVAPTLLRLADLPVPQSFAGRGLLARRDATVSDAFFQHPVYPGWEVSQRREWFGALRSVAGEPVEPLVTDRLQVGVRRGHFKYLRRGARESLFDLEEDPEERFDLAAERPEVLEELRNAVRRWLRQHPIDLGQTDDVDPQLIESLQALGYL